MPGLDEVAQEVAVVRGDLDDEAVGPEPARRDEAERVLGASARAGRSENDEK